VLTLLTPLPLPLLVEVVEGVVLVVVTAVEPPVLVVVVVAAVLVAALVIVRVRESAGSFPLISVIAITSHAATNNATAPVVIRVRIRRARCALVMSSSLGRARRSSVWAA